ncbi:MAG: GNAT family N-acetyltransferase [Rhodospirillaceae bacterium]|nr:GNAT family N-acetyltransferase [Rhodospirillaceae bacterium]
MSKVLQQATLNIRYAKIADIPEIMSLMARTYADMPSYSEDMLRGQITRFSQGQFVAEYNGRIVGYCATFITTEAVALANHTWREITGGGFASRHDSHGDILYGMEVAVDPAMRSKRIGQRFYNERKRLCEQLALKGVVFAGRLPGLARKIKQVGDAETYVNNVQARKIRDQVLSFQLRNGFKIVRILENYLPSDKASMGYATLMFWKNERLREKTPSPSLPSNTKRTVRVASVQYQLRRVNSFEDFVTNVEYFVDVAADYRADFVLFPELFTLQLLSSIPERLSAEQSIAALTEFTPQFKDALATLAVRYNINIVGGSHPSRNDDGGIRNVSYVFLRDGSIYTQTKLHPTPNERYWWNIQGGTRLSAIPTDCGPIGVLICYDCEFPELARHLTDQGAQIIFVPFCTDTREAYNRVRYCAAARAVENQVYVAMAGNVGNLPNVANLDIQYAQSCLLEPCDFGFARDGIAADTTPNTEMVAIADLRLDDLDTARTSGTVRNLADRRFDLYSVDWRAPA